jgi:hypothetical protein
VQLSRQKLIRHPTPHTHALIIKNVEITRQDRVDAKEALEEAILRLRLFKTGPAGFNFAIIDHDGWYDQLKAGGGREIKYEPLGIFFYVVWSQPGMPHTYDIAAEEIDRVRELIAFTAGRKLLQKPPFRYFFRAYHEPYASDRFLRNAIGLENLLVNDTQDQSNTTYKFVDRGCFLLNLAHTHPQGANGYAPVLKKIYSARSASVHSNKAAKRDWGTKEEMDLLNASEDYLRVLLNYVLRNPEMESSLAVDEAKRAKYV